jgi:hypothetical protein
MTHFELWMLASPSFADKPEIAVPTPIPREGHSAHAVSNSVDHVDKVDKKNR